MRVALGQFDAVVGDLTGNSRRIRQIYEQAVEQGVELLVFPELAICGYPPEDLLLKRDFIEENRRVVEALAAEVRQAIVVVGFAEGFQGGCYNAGAVLEGGRVEQVYRKGRVVNTGVFDERRYFRPGGEPVVISCGRLKVAVTICADIWGIEPLVESLGRAGRFQMVVNMSASPFHVGKHEIRRVVVSNCGKRLGCAVGYCNLVGGQDELVFDGRSMFTDGRGRPAGEAKAFAEDLLIADVNVGKEGVVEVQPVHSCEPGPVDDMEDVYAALVLGVRDYMGKNGFQKALLGLSGGIDSSVTAALAAAALGAENVTGVSMPSKFSSTETQRDAGQVSARLGIEFMTVPIEPVVERFDQALSAIQGWDNRGVAYENLQARVRGCILMSLSNQFGSLVLTSGNKSETAVGYTTLYGDTAGGFAVLKDVPKTMVYRLAERINSRAGHCVIPREVISRAPSAELRAGQKDTDTLPDYDMLDEILKGYIEEDKSVEQLAAAGLPGDIAARVVRMVDENEYKRRQSPPGVKVTTKAFGKDRRLPITNRYRRQQSRG